MKNFFRLLRFDLKQGLFSPVIYLGALVSFCIILANHGMLVDDAFESQADYEAAIGYMDYEEFSQVDKNEFIQTQTNGSEGIFVYEDNLSQVERLDLDEYYNEFLYNGNFDSLEEELLLLDEEGKIEYYGFYDSGELDQIDSETYEKIKHSLFAPYAPPTKLSMSNGECSENPTWEQAQVAGAEKHEVENYSQHYSRILMRLSILNIAVATILLTVQLCSRDLNEKRFKFFRNSNVKVCRYLLSKLIAVCGVATFGVFLSTFPFFLFDYVQLADFEWGFRFYDYFMYLLIVAPISLAFVNALTMLILYLSKKEIVAVLIAFPIIWIGGMPVQGYEFPYGMTWSQYIPTVNEFLWGIDVSCLYVVHQFVFLIITMLLVYLCVRRLTKLINSDGTN